jgi:hypothetical protein
MRPVASGEAFEAKEMDVALPIGGEIDILRTWQGLPFFRSGTLPTFAI